MEDNKKSDLEKIIYLFSTFGPILIFAGVGLVALFQHEIWLDEGRAWLLSRQYGFLDLIGVAKTESHPFLWYWVLRSVGIFFENVLALQLTSYFFALGGFALLAFYSPFPVYIKLLLSVNYYILFEYGVIARNYSMEMFFLFLICACWNEKFRISKNKYPQLYVVFCGLLALTHFYGLIISAILLAAFIYDAKREKVRLLNKNYYFYYALASVMIGASVWLVIPDDNLRFELVRDKVPVMADYQRAFSATFKNLFNPEISQTVDISQDYSWSGTFGFLGLIIIGAFIAWLLRSNKVHMSAFIFGWLGFTALHLARAFQSAPPRHTGQYTLLFIVIIWLALQKKEINRVLAIGLCAVFFAFQGYAGLSAVKLDWYERYSNGKDIAEVIMKDYPDYDVIPDLPFLASSYIPYLNVPFYESINKRVVWAVDLSPKLYDGTKLGKTHNGPVYYTDDGIMLERIRTVACLRSPKVLMISQFPRSTQTIPGVILDFVYGAEFALLRHENFFIFKVRVPDLLAFCALK